MKSILPFLFLLATIAFGQPAPIPVPAIYNLPPGSKAEFFATADGNPSPTFEWFKNGVKIADGANFTIPTGTVNDAGVYFAKATNEVGSAVSLSFRLTTANTSTPPGVPVITVRLTVAPSSTAKQPTTK